mgnify:CR=1 FL=1
MNIYSDNGETYVAIFKPSAFFKSRFCEQCKRSFVTMTQLNRHECGQEGKSKILYPEGNFRPRKTVVDHLADTGVIVAPSEAVDMLHADQFAVLRRWVVDCARQVDRSPPSTTDRRRCTILKASPPIVARPLEVGRVGAPVRSSNNGCSQKLITMWKILTSWKVPKMSACAPLDMVLCRRGGRAARAHFRHDRSVEA